MSVDFTISEIIHSFNLLQISDVTIAEKTTYETHRHKRISFMPSLKLFA